ncbi:putative ribonuclease H-like domain-containing protein [Tanacetum coccineum]
MNHPSPKRNMVPKAVLMRSGLVSLTTARPVNTAQPRTTVNSARPMTHIFNKAHSIVRRLINKNTTFKHSNFNQRVNTVINKNVNAARPKAVVNAARPKEILNAVKGNQGNPHQDLHEKGVIDSGCSRHMTGNMSYLIDFEEIDEGYVAFGGNYKGGKITGRGTIKNGNFNFENVYFLSLREQQHKASCKSKTENSISLPLHLLHMDLFGPTFVKSLMKKMYCLVVTYDFSRFTWVFFLATKDETSGILKSFITGIENLVDHKVKVIRCDNGTEFKNKEMNQFCEKNGILKQYSAARTPQQNRVAERRNRTLIEAAKTMLADSKLPTF